MSRFNEILAERDQIQREIDQERDRIHHLRMRLATIDCILEFAQPDADPKASGLSRPTLRMAA